MGHYSFDNPKPHLQNIQNGIGESQVHHMIEAGEGTNCNFIIMAILPPNTSIGLHRHDSTDEEIYIVVFGEGEMEEDGKKFGVRAGDVIVNAPGSEHSLMNTGDQPMKLIAVDIPARS